jgi:hypothetical protein
MYWNPESVFDDIQIKIEEYDYKAEEKRYDEDKEYDLFNFRVDKDG